MSLDCPTALSGCSKLFGKYGQFRNMDKWLSETAILFESRLKKEGGQGSPRSQGTRDFFRARIKSQALEILVQTCLAFESPNRKSRGKKLVARPRSGLPASFPVE